MEATDDPTHKLLSLVNRAMSTYFVDIVRQALVRRNSPAPDVRSLVFAMRSAPTIVGPTAMKLPKRALRTPEWSALSLRKILTWGLASIRMRSEGANPDPTQRWTLDLL